MIAGRAAVTERRAAASEPTPLPLISKSWPCAPIHSIWGDFVLRAGEGRRLDLNVAIEPFQFGGERYAWSPPVCPARLDISRTTGDGYALRLRFAATLVGPCMRCLEPAAPTFAVDAREVAQPGERTRS